MAYVAGRAGALSLGLVLLSGALGPYIGGFFIFSPLLDARPWNLSLRMGFLVVAIAIIMPHRLTMSGYSYWLKLGILVLGSVGTMWLGAAAVRRGVAVPPIARGAIPLGLYFFFVSPLPIVTLVWRRTTRSPDVVSHASNATTKATPN